MHLRGLPRRRRLVPHRHRLLRHARDRDLDGRRLAARRGLDRRGAGLRTGRDHARAHHVRDARVRARPRDLAVRRVVGLDRRGQLHARPGLQRELPVLHTITRDRDGRDRDGGLALDRGQGRGGAVPLHDAAVVVQARLAGSRILLAAAVVEDHLRALGEVVRDHVLVQVGLLAAVGRARGGHLHARPGRVVRRGRAVARVHVRVDLAPARGLRSVDGVLRDRVRRKLTGHGHGDRRGLGPGLRGDRGLAGLPRGDHALRADGRHVLVGRAPAHGRALRIGRGGQLLRGHALGQVHAVIRLINLHGLGRDDHAIAGLPGAGRSVAVPSVIAVDLEASGILAFGGVGRILLGICGIAIVEDDARIASLDIVGNLILVLAILATSVSRSDLCHRFARPLRIFLQSGGARIVYIHIGVQVAPRTRLLRISRACGGRILLRVLVCCGDRLAIRILALQLHGDGVTDRRGSADGDGVAILIRAGLALRSGVGGIGDVVRIQGNGSGVRLERAVARGCGDRTGIVGEEHTDLAAGSRAGSNLAAGNGDGTAGDLVLVGAVVKVGGSAGQLLRITHVGDGHAVVLEVAVLDVAFHHEAGIRAAVAQILRSLVVVHSIAEVVHRHDLRILPRIRTGIAELAFLGELRLAAAGADRAVEVQRHGLGTGTDHAPAHGHLPFAHAGGFPIAIGIVIMRFHPRDKIARAGGVAPIGQGAGVQVLRIQGSAQLAAVGGCGDAAAVLAVAGEQLCIVAIAGDGILQHFAVLELRAIVKNDVPILGAVILVRQFDVLGRIETEPVHTVVDRLHEEIVHHVGGFGVLSVDVIQAEQLAVGHLIAVVPILHITVIAVVVVVLGLLPTIGDGAPSRGHMVGYHIDDDTHAVLVSRVAQALQIIFGTHHPVADGGVGRLIYVVPVLGEDHALAAVMNSGNRLGLHGGVTGFGNSGDVFLNGFEAPLPCMQGGALAHLLRQSVMLARLFERGVFNGVGVAVAIGAGLCCGAGDCQSAEGGRRGGDADHHFLANLQPQPMPGRCGFPMFHDSFVPY